VIKVDGKKDIKACIRCGSNDLKWAPKSEEGIMAKEGMRFTGVELDDGASIAYKCENCGYVGIPIIFDSEKDRQKFIELKKKEKQAIKEKNGSKRITK
jgi:hypothetical protein